MSKVRRFATHVGARATPAERRELEGWLSPDQMRLFQSMHRSDRRHGLDVVRHLRRDGVDDADALMAGLLHDAGKGRSMGLWPRVGWSLGERYGPRARRLSSWLPGFATAYRRLDRHSEISAALAQGAGCSPRTVDLIRNQAEPRDAVLGEALRRADEAS